MSILAAEPLARRLKAFRAQWAHLDLDDFCAMVGINRRLWQRLQDGVGTVTAPTADRICLAMGVHPSEIYGAAWAGRGEWHSKPRRAS